jgi:hypothetical protein
MGNGIAGRNTKPLDEFVEADGGHGPTTLRKEEI